jgi:hypothetical protein
MNVFDNKHFFFSELRPIGERRRLYTLQWNDKHQNINHKQPQATICIAREESACNHVIFTSVRGNAPGESVRWRKHSWEPQQQEMAVPAAKVMPASEYQCADCLTNFLYLQESAFYGIASKYVGIYNLRTKHVSKQ